VPPFFCAAAGLAASSAMQQSIMSAARDLPGKLLVRIQPPLYFLFLWDERGIKS
jgi:hypothetical protein